jgi:hypothetical protein
MERYLFFCVSIDGDKVSNEAVLPFLHVEQYLANKVKITLHFFSCVVLLLALGPINPCGGDRAHAGKAN